jgi:hypothetical protein
MPPTPDSYWVLPGQLLAGEYPGDRNDRETRKRLRGLLEEGVTFFLDLTQAGEYDLKSYAILDHGTPAPEEMTRILDTIDAALDAGHTVYVHCYAGIGRTGTVVGCHLVRHGMSGEGALAEISRLRRGIGGGWISSPETPAQRAMVRQWPAGG